MMISNYRYLRRLSGIALAQIALVWLPTISSANEIATSVAAQPALFFSTAGCVLNSALRTESALQEATATQPCLLADNSPEFTVHSKPSWNLQLKSLAQIQTQDTDRAGDYSLSFSGTLMPLNDFFFAGDLRIKRSDGQYSPSLSPSPFTLGQAFTNATDDKQWALSLGAGYSFQSGALAFIPSSQLRYTERQSAVTEPTSASSNTSELSSLTLDLGGQVSYTLNQSWGVLLPFASFQWVHEFEDGNTLLNMPFSSNASTLSLTTEQTDSNYFNLGVGFSAQFQDGAAAFINYQKLLGHDDDDRFSINAGVRLEF